MEVERVDTVPSFERNNIMFSPKLEHSFDDIQAKTKTSTLRNELTGSYEFDAARVVELDLYEDEEDEDEGEVMLLAMILLQLHGVKFPGGFPDQHNKKKRQRTSPDQLAILEQIFQTDKMPSQQTRVQLADQLGMTSRRVQIWFQNKRAKVKRGVGKSSEGFQQAPLSPQLDIEKDGSPSLSSSSCLSEPSSPLPDSSSPESSSPTTSMLTTTPPSPNTAAVVPSSPSLPHIPRLTPLSSASQLRFSLNSLAAKQQIMFDSEFSTMSSLLRPQGV